MYWHGWSVCPLLPLLTSPLSVVFQKLIALVKKGSRNAGHLSYYIAFLPAALPQPLISSTLQSQAHSSIIFSEVYAGIFSTKNQEYPESLLFQDHIHDCKPIPDIIQVYQSLRCRLVFSPPLARPVKKVFGSLHSVKHYCRLTVLFRIDSRQFLFV